METLVALMDDGFVFHALTAFLLDHRGTIGGLTFLDDRGAVTIAIPIIVPMAFADRHAGANRAASAATVAITKAYFI